MNPESTRLPRRSAADTTGKNHDILVNLESSGEDLTILRLLANSPTLLRPMVMMANALMQRATLSPLDREVLVLHLAVRLENSYEWDEHVSLSVAAGVTDEQRDALLAREPIEPPLFTGAQKLAVALADEIIDTGALSDATWERAATVWGDAAALDLLLSVGFWGGMVPIVTAGLGLAQSKPRG
jgi:alkylhydroperoxidase family enzyme